MFKSLAKIGLLGMSMVVILSTDARAGYPYLGGDWDVNTYEHVITYAVKGADFNSCPPDVNCILYFSNTVWYDNAFSCSVGKNNKNEPFSPGGGHFVLGGTATPALDALCVRRGKCTGTVIYPSSVKDLENDPELLADCQAVVEELYGEADTEPQECFNWLFFGNAEGGTCKNKNDLVSQIFTKGVCSTVQPLVCGDPEDLSTCTAQADPTGVRFTFPTFDQKPNDSFSSQVDDTCIDCVGGNDDACSCPAGETYDPNSKVCVPVE